MSEPESLAPGNKRPVTRRRTGCAGKRKNRPKYHSDIDSDDPDDDDYVDGNDSPAGIGGRPHPTKRRRRTVAPKIASDRLRYPTRDITPAATVSPPDQVADHAPTTGLHDIETIPIQGFLTRHVFLSRIVYTCSFQEDREPPFLYKPAGNATDGEDECRNRNVEPSTSKKPLAHTAARGAPFSPEEDELLVKLKERDNLPWSHIAEYFPGRKKNSLQVRYSTRLKGRGSRTRGVRRSGKTESISDAAATSREVVRDSDLRLRMADSRQNTSDLPPTVSPCRRRYGAPRPRRAVDRYSPV
jgi:hypothetical protein